MVAAIGIILNVFLTVGDVFFRKKILTRVKEMICGGSTVFIVSHSLETVKQHCDRCVWIEKVKLRMVGKPEEVCREYMRIKAY